MHGRPAEVGSFEEEKVFLYRSTGLMAPLRIRGLRSSCTKRFQDSWVAPHWTRGPGRFSPCVAGRLRISTSTTSQPPSSTANYEVRSTKMSRFTNMVRLAATEFRFRSDDLHHFLSPGSTSPGNTTASNQHQRVHSGGLGGWGF
ncbi:predicted protein [Chaetomium globosum CBS 148.51]|uniref:Uncharacterized protein n=1 Tax=Chaetomium globosum (strain ATCC 6205 / CBS 148.51 / DSM 1962 / NBRC 6347 / NRRL 1970) TaxID=306901 RepID=Q2H714_CHAGB|nr:uncharacterized protein CHGG_05551 [Chaetomium globosum CBS 148.51]EAQ88932.1 predicted protein [Chaetomium globosum CBS 148.51]